MSKILALLMALFIPHLSSAQSIDIDSFLSSPNGDEFSVSFKAQYMSEETSLEELILWSPLQKDQYIERFIKPTLKYLFGPLTHRELGGIKDITSIEVDWDNASLKENKVLLPYTYKAIWLISNRYSLSGQILLPIPYNAQDLFTPSWLKCTDSDPEHQTRSFYWYFWDPTRRGCDHVEGIQFENVLVSLDLKTDETSETFPEYQKMIIEEDGKRLMKMTVAFGYVKDPTDPNPETDADSGVAQYRYFLTLVHDLLPEDATDTPIHSLEYYAWGQDRIIGHKFSFVKEDIHYEIKVVANAGVDQMYLFAKSFAVDHDAYFAWLGHSRVGSGFDAQTFNSIVTGEPEKYSISNRYQLVYWGGCNSYSYYTIPFFKIKAAASNGTDPLGTKNLDIIANTLPSFFALNSQNALVQVKALLNWQTPTSYQEILRQTEVLAAQWGTEVLAVVLGDEDNGNN